MDYWQTLLTNLEPTQNKKPTQKSKRTLNRYSLDQNDPSMYLTEQEARCIYHLLKNHTIRETGSLLQLSHRTVEFYLKRIRTRTKTRNKRELLDRIRKSHFKYPFKKSPTNLH